MLGLSAVVSGGPSLITVTTIDALPDQVRRFLRLIGKDGHAALACATMLAHEVTTSFNDVHDLLLARSSTEKLARLLLSWSRTSPQP